MQKKSIRITFIIISIAVITFQGMNYLIKHFGREMATMVLAYLSVLFLLWQLIRLIRAVNLYQKAIAGPLKERDIQPLHRWNPEAEAPRRWSAFPSVFFGERTYTWEELIVAYAFFVGVIWAVRFLIQTVG